MTMPKSYTDYQKEISPEKLYHGLLAHGLFPEKLPPFLYNFKLMNRALDDVIKGNNCIAILLTYLYVKKQSDQHSIKILKDYARRLINTDVDFEKNWLFCLRNSSKK